METGGLRRACLPQLEVGNSEVHAAILAKAKRLQFSVQRRGDGLRGGSGGVRWRRGRQAAELLDARISPAGPAQGPAMVREARASRTAAQALDDWAQLTLATRMSERSSLRISAYVCRDRTARGATSSRSCSSSRPRDCIATTSAAAADGCSRRWAGYCRLPDRSTGPAGAAKLKCKLVRVAGTFCGLSRAPEDSCLVKEHAETAMRRRKGMRSARRAAGSTRGACAATGWNECTEENLSLHVKILFCYM